MVKILSEERFEKEFNSVVTPYLTKRLKEGYFKSFDGKELYYNHYKADKKKGAVVIVHGYTESVQKYLELIYYFLQSGLSCYIYDQRGHGKSFREVDDERLIYVDNFNSYVKDLQSFLNEVVIEDAPVYAFGHSMGGAVLGLYLENDNNKIKKAILTSPMFKIKNVKASFIVKPLAYILSVFASKKLPFYSKNPTFKDFENSSFTSLERYIRYEKVRRLNTEYSTCAPTNKWAYEALNACDNIMKKGAVEKINIPVRVYSAENDSLVDNEYHFKFAKRLPIGEYKIIKNAKHEIFNTVNAVFIPYLNEVLKYFS